MKFKEHSFLTGQHAFLSASKYHWLNYTEEKLIKTYTASLAAVRGTRLHEFAKECILLSQKLPKGRKALNNYVNDAIGFKMTPEVVLYYSDHAFGTADCISFRNDMLRIHDLKTGASKPSMMQLLIYAALFCLEYEVDPYKIKTELRIYQTNEIHVESPEGGHIFEVMQKIKFFDKKLKEMDSIMEDEPWPF